MTYISVPIEILHTTKPAALNQPRFRKCTRERRACQFSPYFRGHPNCTMFTVGHAAGDLFRGSQLDSLSWSCAWHVLYLRICSHYFASHGNQRRLQCYITHGITWIFAIICHTCHKASLCPVLTLSLCVHPVLNSGRRTSNRSSKLTQTSPAEQESSFSLDFQPAYIFSAFLLVGLGAVFQMPCTRLRENTTWCNMSGCNWSSLTWPLLCFRNAGRMALWEMANLDSTWIEDTLWWREWGQLRQNTIIQQNGPC